MGPQRTGTALAEWRLRTYVRLNLAAALVGTCCLAFVRIWVVPSAWVYVIIVLLAGLTVCLLGADAMLARHRYVAAIVTIAVSNWVIATAAIAIAPFGLLLMPLGVLLPTLLAVPHLDREQLAAMLGATIIAAGAMTVVGRIQHGVGLEALAPTWVLDSETILFIPITAGLLSFLAWQNHVSLSAQAEALQDSRARLVSASDRERHRIERYLHDGAQQRLVAAAMQLRVVQRLLSKGLEEVSPLISQLADDLQEASAELRDLAHGIYPPELAEHGLESALRTAALRSPLPTTVQAEGVGRYPTEIEVNVYFCCVEALQNAIKHAGDHATVTISLQDRAGLSFEVRDDGQGCEPTALQTGHGFTNMSDRLGAIGGSLDVQSQVGAGVHVQGHVPRLVLAQARSVTSPRWASAVRDSLAGFWTLVSLPWGRVRPDASDEQQAVTGITALLIFTAGSALFVLALLARMPNAALFAVTTATAIVGLFLVGARHLAARKRKQQAVLTSAVVFWAYALVLTSLIPITLYQSPLVLVTPVILAAPYVSHHRFKVIIAVTVAVAIAVAVAGSQLPGLGIQEHGHDWLVDLIIIGLRLVGTALLLFMAWQSHVSLSTKAVALRESRARLVSATDRERRRIERNLHDGTQQRLVAATMQLRVAQRLLSRRPEQVSPLISQLAGDLQEAGAELRDLAHWIYPPELAEHGLESALRTAASRSPLPTTVKAEGIGRYPSEVEVNVYFCCLEALQNAIKHAGEQATVTISLQNRAGLSCEVRDNGQGCEPAALQAGHGFINMSDRVGAIGGSLNVQSQPGAGVHVQCHIGLPG